MYACIGICVDTVRESGLWSTPSFTPIDSDSRCDVCSRDCVLEFDVLGLGECRGDDREEGSSIDVLPALPSMAVALVPLLPSDELVALFKLEFTLLSLSLL